MALINDLLFETQRRVILFRSGTIMPDGSFLGYNGDPNLVDQNNSDGEYLIYNCPQGTRYQEDDGTQWFKKESPNSWVVFAGSGGTSLSSLTDTTLTSVSDDDILKYKDSEGAWINEPFSSALSYPTVVERTISAGTEETFYSKDLSNQISFEWSIELQNSDKAQFSKVSAVYNESIMESTEYSIIGHFFLAKINVEENGGFCDLKIKNNESYSLNCKVILY